jgi:hypothetical protein
MHRRRLDLSIITWKAARNKLNSALSDGEVGSRQMRHSPEGQVETEQRLKARGESIA